MEWEIKHLQDIGIISAVVSGAMTSEGIKKHTGELLEASRKSGVNRVLCDCRTASPNITLSEIYYLPQILKDLGVSHHHKVAIVYSASPATDPYFIFLDDCCYNTGLGQRVFTDYETAYRWLLESAKQP
jgi:hypothetical protein